MSHKEITNIIKAIRESFIDASIIYTFGGCYGFYKILKSVYKKAIPYCEEEDGHIVTRIGDRYYDIYGEYIKLDGELKGEIKKLTNKQKEYWESVASGQRVEYIIKKYNE